MLFRKAAKQARKSTPLDDEQIQQFLDCKLNSSKEAAGVASTHNLIQQQINRQHLLSMPINVRTQIFRHVVVNSRASITVRADAPSESSEPELTRVCHDIRTEALPLFYRENAFVVQVKEYDIRPLLPWLKRAELFRTRDPVAEPEASSFEPIIIRTDGQTHWDNLQEWLKLAHAGKVSALVNDDYEGGGQFEAVKGAFTVVMGIKGYPWKVVERVLPGVKELLAAGDGRWVDREEEELADDSGVMLEDPNMQLVDDGEEVGDDGLFVEDSVADDEDVAEQMEEGSERTRAWVEIGDESIDDEETDEE